MKGGRQARVALHPSPFTVFKIMGIHTAEAIVLRQYPYRETSALVTCLTDRVGKIKGLIKGLRASAGRYRSAMDPLSLNRIVFYDSRSSSLHLITQCELVSAFHEVTRDLEWMRLATFCAELVDAVLELEEPQPQIFVLLSGMLSRLTTESAMHRQGLRIHFVLRLLRLAGFQPQLDECVGCGRRPVARGFWSARQGGLLCERCLHEDPTAEAVSAEWVEALSSSAESDTPLLLDNGQGTLMQQRLDEFLRWRLDRPLKTMRDPVETEKASRPRLSP